MGHQWRSAGVAIGTVVLLACGGNTSKKGDVTGSTGSTGRGGMTTTGAVLGAGSQAGASTECSTCSHAPEARRLDVYYGQGDVCVVLKLAGGDTCEGLNIGAGDWCLTQAGMWRPARACPPPADADRPTTAISASGSVVGHDGGLHVTLDLAFPDAADQSSVHVDLRECVSLQSLEAPCPWP